MIDRPLKTGCRYDSGIGHVRRLHAERGIRVPDGRLARLPIPCHARPRRTGPARCRSRTRRSRALSSCGMGQRQAAVCVRRRLQRSAPTASPAAQPMATIVNPVRLGSHASVPDCGAVLDALPPEISIAGPFQLSPKPSRGSVQLSPKPNRSSVCDGFGDAPRPSPASAIVDMAPSRTGTVTTHTAAHEIHLALIVPSFPAVPLNGPLLLRREERANDRSMRPNMGWRFRHLRLSSNVIAPVAARESIACLLTLRVRVVASSCAAIRGPTLPAPAGSRGDARSDISMT
jgi:hypothetical protein